MRTYSTETVRDILTTAITLSPPATFEQAQSLLTLAVKAISTHPPQTQDELDRVYVNLQALDKTYGLARKMMEAKDAITA